MSIRRGPNRHKQFLFSLLANLEFDRVIGQPVPEDRRRADGRLRLHLVRHQVL